MSDSSTTGTERVYEIELAADGDHSTHENTLTVLVVESSMEAAAEKAGQVADQRRPGFIGKEVSALHCGSSSLESSETWTRQHLDDQDDVIVGPEVPV